jgi:hypothetical protein|tara:strand:+ start:358 stop:510 length:153 start_codon:yes stop_codon:yes gene_type:complete
VRYIEQGEDKFDIECWFVLNDAALIGLYYTLEAAEYCQQTGICEINYDLI